MTCSRGSTKRRSRCGLLLGRHRHSGGSALPDGRLGGLTSREELARCRCVLAAQATAPGVVSASAHQQRQPRREQVGRGRRRALRRGCRPEPAHRGDGGNWRNNTRCSPARRSFGMAQTSECRRALTSEYQPRQASFNTARSSEPGTTRSVLALPSRFSTIPSTPEPPMNRSPERTGSGSRSAHSPWSASPSRRWCRPSSSPSGRPTPSPEHHRRHRSSRR